MAGNNNPYASNIASSQGEGIGQLDQLPQKESQEHSEHSPPATQHLTGIRYHLAVVTLCLAIFLVTLDNTIIATATPYISDEFHSLTDVAWYSSAYTMAVCTSQPLFGKLLARYSIRWIYSVAMFLFLVGSAVCGSAPNSHALIIGRAVAGLGCAGLLVAAFSLVPFLVPPRKRPIVMGLLSATRGLATSCGPLIGGALTEKVSWRWNFYINLPIGAVLQATFLFLVHPPKRDSDAFTSLPDFIKVFNPFGLLALLPAIVSLLLGLQWGGVQYPWQDARVIALLTLAAVLAAAFVGIEVWQGANTMLPPRVFTGAPSPPSSSTDFAQPVLSSSSHTTFRCVKGASPIQSGVWTLPWVITSTIVGLGGGVLIAQVGYPNAFMGLGTVFGAVGAGLFTTFTVNTPTGEWIGYQIIYAVSSSLCSLTPLMVAQQALPLKDVSIGTGMVMFSQMIGASIFVAVAQAIFTNDLSHGLKSTGLASVDASSVLSGSILTLTEGLDDSSKRAVLIVLNHALTRSWQLAVILSCISIIGSTMRFTVLAALATSLLFSQALAHPEPCNGRDVWADPTDCHAFYQCGGNNMAIRKTCGPGTAYHHDTKSCGVNDGVCH
ncbi:MFS general substrate transporter [Aspergillus ambiguus]|uniref:MFS general substrate transporter n=1 Tax=Aspergillus ambiguus TaxID=176160 RepID=UPI003CCCF867